MNAITLMKLTWKEGGSKAQACVAEEKARSRDGGRSRKRNEGGKVGKGEGKEGRRRKVEEEEQREEGRCRNRNEGGKEECVGIGTKEGRRKEGKLVKVSANFSFQSFFFFFFPNLRQKFSCLFAFLH